jgi:hypothetical protein
MSNGRPFALPEDVGLKRNRASVYLFRAAAVALRARVEGTTPEIVARQMFKGDPVTDIITRAASASATITGSGWADALAATSIQDLLMQISSVSAAAALILRGLQLDFAGFASIKVPGRLVDASDAGTWVVEGQPAPVRTQRMTPGVTLVLRKLSINTSYTNEMVRASNIEAISRALLTEACALALDKAMFSATAANGQPAGLLNGLTALTPTAGGGLNAMTGDIRGLMDALVTNYAGKTPVLIMSPTEALSLRMMASPLFNTPILESSILAATKTVIMIEPSSFASAFGATPEFDIVDSPLFHFEDTNVAQITGGAPSPAVPVRSPFQVDSLVLRLRLKCAWGLRMPTTAPHIAFVSNVTW